MLAANAGDRDKEMELIVILERVKAGISYKYLL